MSELDAEMHAPRLDTTALRNPQRFFDDVVARCKEQINVMLPCRIESYDRATHIADLRVLFNWKMADGKIMDGCVLKNITIRRLFAGGFLIDFPISVGDTGWIFACDRDAYDSKEENAPRLPPTPYCNSYASGFWLPDQWGSDKKLGICGVTRDAQDNPVDESGRLVIESATGTEKISIGSEDIRVSATDSTVNVSNNHNLTVAVRTDVTCPIINIAASTSVAVTSPSVIVNSENDNPQGASSIELKARNVKISGALEVTGDVTARSKMTVSGALNASTVKATSSNTTLGGHIHTDSQGGSTSIGRG